MDFSLSDDQFRAYRLIVDWFYRSKKQIFVLAGYAGTGKTTLLKHVVVDALKLTPDVTAAYVTPTGKAATVLIRSGIPATTLHRLIYHSETVEQEIVVNNKTLKIERLAFKRRQTIDKAIKLIVLDEASMVSDDVIFDLLNFGVKLLICGDPAQLPPIEGVNTFLSEPDYTLKQIVRQQADNPIIKLAQLVREGGEIPYRKYGNVAVIPMERFFGDGRRRTLLAADQIICGTNKTRKQINKEVRSYLGFGALPQTGDKLICTQNNWEIFIDGDMRFNLVNGIIGRAYDPFYDSLNNIGFLQFKPDFLDEMCPEALPFDTGIFTNMDYRYKMDEKFLKYDENGEPVGAFTLNRFEYGYCISCHKAQGSEFDNVIVFDESDTFEEDKNRWLYTAITRAKKKLIILR